MPRFITTRIPAEPLLNRIAAMGGADALVPDTESPEYHSLRMRLNRARMRGWIDLYQADEICVDHLHVHPFDIYGYEWFEFHPDEPVADAHVRMAGEVLVLGAAA